MSGQKIIEGLKDAISGNFGRVTIDGQVWERRGNEEWQPIATAPTDGRRVLLHNELWDDTFGTPQIGSMEEPGWVFESGMRVDPDAVEADGDDLTVEDYQPTHWMPLPFGPAQRSCDRG